MWLINSSIGRKFVMALTGICLVLFVTFHVLMNAVAICWPAAYNQVCEFLGANWYALIASMGLGLLFIIHIIYALCLTLQNRKARGNDQYKITSRPKSVEWSSKNMLVLGIVVLAFLAVHLCQFWYKMQAQEVMHQWYKCCCGAEIPPAAGTLFIQFAFEQWWTPVVYIIGFVALWFHMNHGFWSMWHSVGWDNTKWLNRWKAIGCWWTTIVIALFTVQAIVFTVRAADKYYLTNDELQAQYYEMCNASMKEAEPELMAEQAAIIAKADAAQTPEEQMELREEFQALQTKASGIQKLSMNRYQAILKLADRCCATPCCGETECTEQCVEQTCTGDNCADCPEAATCPDCQAEATEEPATTEE